MACPAHRNVHVHVHAPTAKCVTVAESVHLSLCVARPRSRVFHLPAVTDTKYALRNWLQGKRFVFWDEYSPVEFAELGVMAVTTFKKAFCGQTFEALGS